MMSRIHFSYAAWLLAIFFLLYSPQAVAEIKEKPFPIPPATVELAVTNWLQASGFRIYRTSVNYQKTDIRAEKGAKNWHIVISPQSALACHVKAQFTGPDNIVNDTHYQSLWAQISKQAQQLIVPVREKANKTIPSQIYRHARAVVCMRLVNNGDERQVSGFFLRTREGLIVSTAHDLSTFQNLTVVLTDGSEISGQVIQLDQQLDLALIRVASKPDTGILLHKKRKLLNLGDRLYTIGCSSNGRGELTSGFVNGPPRRADNQLLWQVKMTVLPGNSGSPVFDDNGQLVAVVKGRHRVEDQVGFLIPMETLITFINANANYVK